MALRSGAKLAVKLAQTTGAFASGRAYVQRYFPPGYREPATKLITAFEQAALGAGLYQVGSTLFSDDGTGIPSGFQKTPKHVPYSQRKTRGGRGRNSNRRFQKHCSSTKYCRCTPRRF